MINSGILKQLNTIQQWKWTIKATCNKMNLTYTILSKRNQVKRDTQFDSYIKFKNRKNWSVVVEEKNIDYFLRRVWEQWLLGCTNLGGRGSLGPNNVLVSKLKCLNEPFYFMKIKLHNLYTFSHVFKVQLMSECCFNT